MNLLDLIIISIVEGLTEFLPVSSTGHMMIAEGLLGVEMTTFVKSFTVIIQLGAILAVVVLYWRKFFYPPADALGNKRQQTEHLSKPHQAHRILGNGGRAFGRFISNSS